MKILGLDVGDNWTGVAISDPSEFIARPYETIMTNALQEYITKVTIQESITTIIVGCPRTLRNTESEQTKKIVQQTESLRKEFPHLSFILWDERLSSKHASTVRRAKTKEEKLKMHAIAAAFILNSYLTYRQTITHTNK